MKRLYYILLSIILCISAAGFSSCRIQVFYGIPRNGPAGNTGLSVTEETASASSVFEPETETAAEVTTVQPVTAEPSAESSTAAETETPLSEETPSAEEPTTAELITEETQTTAAPPETAPDTTAKPSEEVTLNISMPEPNGTMVVDTSAENKFVSAVSSSENLDTELLAAVYSVPESGQNYVFEFYSAEGRTKDDLRRVYLLDAAGNVQSVAAVKAAEKRNISSTENWFCINVLIKGVIFPAVEKDF